MKLANLRGRLCLITPSGAVDVARESDGRFSADPQEVYGTWDSFKAWAEQLDAPTASVFNESDLEAAVPYPRQVFVLGLNYQDHAAETELEPPERPYIFTKFPTCLVGQDAAVGLPSEMVDWEVELVLVIGRGGHAISHEDAWTHIAGLTIGQDVSNREMQLGVLPWPQLTLGKSFPGFGPTGPYVVTLDEFRDPNDLAIECSVNGEVMQRARTSEMIFGVPATIEKISEVVPLLAGDIIFTGTPAGVGVGQSPMRFLQSGDVVVSTIEGIGELRTRFVK
jgi:2-keto-4-pentenoate hydratase/2-oxohepta-3-ene-1,7-dioic acid hydratase in catechol pathway